MGYSGSGLLSQSGGTNTVTGGNPLYLGYLGGATGVYTLAAQGLSTLEATNTWATAEREYSLRSAPRVQ